jgi:hypothetical protein
MSGELKTVRFTQYKHIPSYDCDGGSGHSGEYVKAEEVRELFAKAQAASECWCTPLEDAAMTELRAAIAKHTKGPTP